MPTSSGKSPTCCAAEKDGAEKLDKRDLCKRRAEIITERSRVLGPLEKGIARVEAEIEAREKRLKLLHTAMQEIEDLFVELEDLTREFDLQTPCSRSPSTVSISSENDSTYLLQCPLCGDFRVSLWISENVFCSGHWICPLHYSIMSIPTPG